MGPYGTEVEGVVVNMSPQLSTRLYVVRTVEALVAMPAVKPDSRQKTQIPLSKWICTKSSDDPAMPWQWQQQPSAQHPTPGSSSSSTQTWLGAPLEETLQDTQIQCSDTQMPRAGDLDESMQRALVAAIDEACDRRDMEQIDRACAEFDNEDGHDEEHERPCGTTGGSGEKTYTHT